MPMSSPEPLDYLNDNVHGRIGLTQLERTLARTAPFLRLGRIQQLGLASLVFPGATHTRMAHSLGALHIMSRITDHLGLEKDEREKLRIAALLHDIGQYPLSHAIEFAYRKIGAPSAESGEIFANPERLDEAEPHRLPLRAAASRVGLAPQAKDKQMAAEIIRRRPDLQQVFTEFGKSPDFIEEVIQIVTGEHPDQLYKQLMDSDYDCDRLDFCLRDAELAGVNYGLIDLEYFIENLSVRRDPPHSDIRVLAVNKRRALHTLEHYLTARYYMYSQVVHHKNVKCLELIARAIVIEMARRGLMYRNYREIVEEIPNDEFLFFDDTYFFGRIFEYYKGAAENDPLRELIGRLIYRRPFETAKDIRKLVDRDEELAGQEYHNVEFLLRERNLADLCNGAGVDPETVIAENVPVEFVPLGHSIPFKDVLRDAGESAEAIRRSPRLFVEDRDEVEYLLRDQASILYYLAKVELRIIRVFLAIEDTDAVARLSAEFDARLRSPA